MDDPYGRVGDELIFRYPIKKKEKKNCFPNPKGKGKPQSLKVSLLPQGTTTPSKKGQLFYDLGEEGEDHLSLGRET